MRMRGRVTAGATALLAPMAMGVTAPAVGASATEPTCQGEEATIVGTDERDVLVGTEGPDVIVGLGGRDRIDGRGGDDLICGGQRGDRLLGGAGDDRIYGQARADRVIGGPGDDFVDGGAGGAYLDYTDADRRVVVNLRKGTAIVGDSTDRFVLGSIQGVYGSPYGDWMLAGPEPAELMGRGGPDTLIGGPGQDDLFGDAGDDTLRGGRGWNYLLDGRGDDDMKTRGPAQFVNGAGADLVVGGPHDDQVDYLKAKADRGDIIRMRAGDDRVEAGLGDDRINGGRGHDWAGGGRGHNTCVAVEQVRHCQI